MIIYYSFKGATKIYAEILAELLKEQVFELEETSPRNGTAGLIKGLAQNMLGLTQEVKQLPDVGREKIIYICSPIWVGTMTPAIRYFIKKADLNKKKVNVLMTCNTLSDTYKKSAIQLLHEKKCHIGFTEAFVNDSKTSTDYEIIREHLSMLVLNIDKSK